MSCEPRNEKGLAMMGTRGPFQSQGTSCTKTLSWERARYVL